MENFSISANVSRALAAKASVVALETTVLTHGFEPGVALDAYAEMLEAVHRGGAVPAPVGVVDGKLCVGLGEEDLSRLHDDETAQKVGLSELAPVLASGASGGTTVSTTLWAARKAGIGVFATGGIGGVHRGVAETLDISSDLEALSRYGGCVVCSGAKALCDLPKTLEVLETLGVPVVGYGTDRLPAFTCADSGLTLRHRVDSPRAATELVRVRDALGLEQAILVANPPPEETALGWDCIETALGQALEQAKRAGLSGPEVTPHLLQAMDEASGGDAVTSNRALLVANAGLAAEIAVELVG